MGVVTEPVTWPVLKSGGVSVGVAQLNRHATSTAPRSRQWERVGLGAADVLASLKEAMKSDDKDRIDQAASALAEASGSLAQRVYGQAAGDGGQPPGGDGADRKPGDNVVDAEFEEVKENRK